MRPIALIVAIVGLAPLHGEFWQPPVKFSSVKRQCTLAIPPRQLARIPRFEVVYCGWRSSLGKCDVSEYVDWTFDRIVPVECD